MNLKLMTQEAAILRQLHLPARLYFFPPLLAIFSFFPPVIPGVGSLC